MRPGDERDPQQSRAAARPGLSETGPPGDIVSAVVELIATWGASEHPAFAEILAAVAAPGGLDLLKTLHSRGRDLLSPDLQREIDQAAALADGAEAWRAPSFRARLESILDRAGDELAERLAAERGSLGAQLSRWSSVLEWDALNRALRALWRAEEIAALPDQLSFLDELRGVAASLDTARVALVEELEGLMVSGASGSGAPPETLQAAREAVASGDPEGMARALGVLRLRSRGDDERARRAELIDLRDRLEKVWGQARGLLEGRAGDLAPGSGRLLADALGEAERALRETRSAAGGRTLEAGAAALISWERTLREIVESLPVAVEQGRAARMALASSLRDEMTWHLASVAGEASDEGLAAAGEKAAAELSGAAAAGGTAFQSAVQSMLGLIRKARSRHQSALEKAASRLKESARQLAPLLEKDGHLLPTARVVQARLWLEQADGLIAAGEVGGIEALTRSIDGDLEELKRLVALVQKRRRSQEESQRDALHVEVSRIAKAASGRSAKRLESIEADLEKADQAGIDRLREQIEREGAAIEREVRLGAGRILHAADGWLGKAGKRAEGRRPKQAPELERVAGLLRGALAKGDLPNARARAGELRSALLQASPMRRPGIRIGLAATLLALAAGGAFVARSVTNPAKPRSCKLTLDGDPGRRVWITLYSGGRMHPERKEAAGGATVQFDLPPGRYDVFVDDRYTGKSVQVPGGEEVTGIPIPTAQ